MKQKRELFDIHWQDARNFYYDISGVKTLICDLAKQVDFPTDHDFIVHPEGQCNRTPAAITAGLIARGKHIVFQLIPQSGCAILDLCGHTTEVDHEKVRWEILKHCQPSSFSIHAYPESMSLANYNYLQFTSRSLNYSSVIEAAIDLPQQLGTFGATLQYLAPRESSFQYDILRSFVGGYIALHSSSLHCLTVDVLYNEGLEADKIFSNLWDTDCISMLQRDFH